MELNQRCDPPPAIYPSLSVMVMMVWANPAAPMVAMMIVPAMAMASMAGFHDQAALLDRRRF